MFKKILYWFDQRLPITATFERHLSKYPAPIGQNFWYLAGVLLIVVFVIQFISGIWLVMGLGAYPGTDELSIGMLGMHGTYEANMAMHDSD